jgi:hypothetical protein
MDPPRGRGESAKKAEKWTTSSDSDIVGRLPEPRLQPSKALQSLAKAYECQFEALCYFDSPGNRLTPSEESNQARPHPPSDLAGTTADPRIGWVWHGQKKRARPRVRSDSRRDLYQ